MPLPEIPQTGDKFYFNYRCVSSAPGAMRFPVPYACVISNVIGTQAGGAGGGTDIVLLVRKNATTTVATVTFPTAGSNEGNPATVVFNNPATQFARGDQVDISVSSGAWILTLPCALTIECQAL